MPYFSIALSVLASVSLTRSLAAAGGMTLGGVGMIGAGLGGFVLARRKSA